MTHPIPTEDQEAQVFAQMLRLKHYLFSHIVNEHKHNDWGAIMRAKRLGKNKGVPDYIILKENELVFVEMKRKSGGAVSDEQRAWIDGLNRIPGVRAAVCQGAEEAIKFVEKKSTKLKQ